MALIVLRLEEAAMVFSELVEERYTDTAVDELASTEIAKQFDEVMDEYLDAWMSDRYNNIAVMEDVTEAYLCACKLFKRLEDDYGMLGYFSRIMLLDSRGNIIVHTEELERVPTDYYFRRHREGGILLSVPSSLTGYRIPTSYHTRNFRLRISTAVY